MSRIPSPLVLALSLLSLGAGCAAPGTVATAEWRADVIWKAPTKLGGCAVGELVGRAPGQEIVAVSITGEIHRLHREGDGWAHRVLADTPGELIQVAIGDADPTRPGDEVLAVGMKAGTEEDGGPGMAWLLTDVDGPEPVLVPLLEDTALLHAGCIADVDPDHAGAEIVVAGFGRTVHVLAHDGAGYVQTRAAQLAGAAKQVVGWQGGALVACANGELVHVRKQDGAWTSRVLATAPAGLARLGPSDGAVAVARDDGALWLVDADGSGTVVHREGEKLRGAVHAELDPAAPGLELASAGYEGRLVVLSEGPDGERRAETVWREDQRLHHLASGEVDASGVGLELVACGYSGNVVVVRRTGDG